MKNYPSLFLDTQHTWFGRVKAYVTRHTLAVEAYVVITVALVMAGKLPYLNIVFTRYTTMGILVISAAFLFHAIRRLLLWIIIALFGLALTLTLSGKITDAESVGDIIYFLVWFMAVIFAKDLWKNR